MLTKADMPFIKGGAKIALKVGVVVLFVLFTFGTINFALNNAPSSKEGKLSHVHTGK